MTVIDIVMLLLSAITFMFWVLEIYNERPKKSEYRLKYYLPLGAITLNIIYLFVVSKQYWPISIFLTSGIVFYLAVFDKEKIFFKSHKIGYKKFLKVAGWDILAMAIFLGSLFLITLVSANTLNEMASIDVDPNTAAYGNSADEIKALGIKLMLLVTIIPLLSIFLINITRYYLWSTLLKKGKNMWKFASLMTILNVIVLVPVIYYLVNLIQKLEYIVNLQDVVINNLLGFSGLLVLSIFIGIGLIGKFFATNKFIEASKEVVNVFTKIKVLVNPIAYLVFTFMIINILFYPLNGLSISNILYTILLIAYCAWARIFVAEYIKKVYL